MTSLLYVTRFALDASFVTLDFLFTESAVCILYKHNTNAFLYFSQNMDFPQIGFEPEPTVSNIKKEGYSKSVGSNAGCYFCPFLWVEFLGTLLVVFALFS